MKIKFIIQIGKADTHIVHPCELLGEGRFRDLQEVSVGRDDSLVGGGVCILLLGGDQVRVVVVRVGVTFRGMGRGHGRRGRGLDVKLPAPRRQRRGGEQLVDERGGLEGGAVGQEGGVVGGVSVGTGLSSRGG